MKIKLRNLSYERRKQFNGFLFLLPWLIGVVYFFLKPMVRTFLLSFNNVTFLQDEIVEKFIGMENYRTAFFVDAEFLPALVSSFKNIVLQVPLIIIFSMFVAVLLNNKFKGCTFFRAVFFLPVIISSGPILGFLQGQDAANIVSGGSDTMLFSAISVGEILKSYSLSTGFIEKIVVVVDSIFNLVWKSGVQILLYISALKSISPTLYEASHIEGATKWENFWKITFPMTTPILITNIVYTIIDQFTDMNNPMIEKIFRTARQLNIQFSAAMSTVYFLLIIIVIGVVYKILNKLVFYQVD